MASFYKSLWFVVYNCQLCTCYMLQLYSCPHLFLPLAPLKSDPGLEKVYLLQPEVRLLLLCHETVSLTSLVSHPCRIGGRPLIGEGASLGKFH